MRDRQRRPLTRIYKSKVEVYPGWAALMFHPTNAWLDYMEWADTYEEVTRRAADRWRQWMDKPHTEPPC